MEQLSDVPEVAVDLRATVRALPALGDRGLPFKPPASGSVPPEMRRGQSLILVLVSLFFLSALVLALLAAFGVELNSSNNYANGASVRELSNSTVNLAMGLIATATSGTNTTTDGNGSLNLDWASQPGMIRTYDTTGAMVNAYKLYSSPTLVQSASAFSTTNEVSAMANWSSNTAYFTDLNSPITDPLSGATVYPILDPNAVDPNVASSPSAPTTGVEGFWFGEVSTTSNGVIGNFNAPTGPNGTAYKGQMPVTWLYVLKNGEIIPPDTTSTTTATFANAATPPSATDPIVGRIAFWTDDETCKVNVNTASAGYFAANGTTVSSTNTDPWTQTFWDTPRVFTYADRALGKYQPFQNEFQRYPGHPAMTDLPTALPASLTYFSSTSSTSITNYCNSVYNLTPRYNSSGGSQVASVAVPSNSNYLTAMSLKYNRFYDSVDELLFTPSRTAQTLSTGSNVTLTASELEQSRFFITAHSRAPEVNVFNQPRIACWPINSTSGTNALTQTTMDQTIAFCSTLNGSSTNSAHVYPYYFQRSDPTSPKTDMPAAVSATGLGRNFALFKYLHYLTNLPFPGFGGSSGSHHNTTYGFASKYGTNSENDQILTEIFDYIRCININDKSTGATAFAPTGQVVPIQIAALDGSTNTTMGFGRFALPYEIGMDFVCVGTGTNTTTTNTTYAVDTAQANTSNPPYKGKAGSVGGVPNDNTKAVQAILIMSFMNPGAGTPSYSPSFTVQVSGMNNFQIGTTTTTTNMGFPSMGATYVNNGLTSGGIIDPIHFVGNKLFNQSTMATTNFPFYSNIIELPINGPPAGKFVFTGGAITINIYPGNTISGNPIWTVTNLTLPTGTSSTGTFTLPVEPDPGVREMGTGTAYSNFYTNADKFVSSLAVPNEQTFFGWDFQDTTNSPFGVSPPTLSDSNNQLGSLDTVQSMVLTSGDVRMAFQPIIDNSNLSLYGADNTSATAKVNASFVGIAGQNATYQQCASGALVKGVSSYLVNQFVPHTLSQAINNGESTTTSTNNPLGDWDSGEPNMQDGPYINKVDEGDLTSTNSYIPYYPSYTGYTPVVNSYFSPNRMMPSSGMLGSLSTGVRENHPWETLLFRPDNTWPIPSGGINHYGAGVFTGSYSGSANAPGSYESVGNPGYYLPDHLYMDLFWMPVVEPYPISEPFSTAGKINMNYQIMPFAFINRETAIRAVLKYERPLTIPSNPGTSNSAAVGYIERGWKDMNLLNNLANSNEPNYAAKATDWRYTINLDQTLIGFRQRFAAGDLFRAPSEICLIPLVPQNNTVAGNFNPGNYAAETYADMLAPVTAAYSTSFWYNHALTGDNLRERPYANIYPRLTTKSNTFTVHYWVQTLKKASSTAVNTWVQGTDLVTGEFRGSSIIERYIDPNVTVPDYATNSSAAPLSTYYKFRVVSTKQFNP